MKRFFKILCAVVIIMLLLFVISIPIVNDISAAKVEWDLKELPLPEQTEFIESTSKAGKLVGNGNGMQYFGAILIKSNLTLEDLDEFYSQYRESEWDYIVDIQQGQEIDEIEHGNTSFKYIPSPSESYYIVYSWGNGISFFDQWDIRGH